MTVCKGCGRAIHRTAAICPHCGFGSVVVLGQPTWNPGVAAVLSFFIPGLGQIYKGQILNGLVWFFCVAVGYVCLIIPGALLHICCIYGAYSGHPANKRAS
jgi:TM2 domain-containing membrane protein YozV